MQEYFEAKNVSKSFGGIKALKEISLTLEKNKITSLIGPNGAGKTTFFNLVTGTLPVDKGTIKFKGEDITHLKSFEICRKGIVRTYQQQNLFSNLTIFKNIEAGTMKDDLNNEERNNKVFDILSFLNLEKKHDITVKNLSPLECKFVELGRSLATDPEIILLDELIGGLVTSETDKICEIVETLCLKGYTIFQVGHEMKPIMKTSDWIYVLDKGEKIAEGTPNEIKNNKLVQQVYLESGGE